MQNSTQTNLVTVQRLPLQAAPINRSMTSSALGSDSGVQPSILGTLGVAALIGWLLS